MKATMKPLCDRIIPWYFVLFFLVIAAVNAVMVTLAVRTLPGTVTDHPYEKGLAYNQVVLASNKQDALGWKSDIIYDKGQLQFTLHDRNNKPITAEKVTAKLFRPSKATMDFMVTLPHGVAPIHFPANGLWEVQVEALVSNTHYQCSKRIVVP